MKIKQKKTTLSEKIADALTIKPRADIEDDQVFGTKPKTVSRVDFSSGSDDEAAISDFHKTNVNLLSEISKKYEGQVVSKKDLEEGESEESDEESASDDDTFTAQKTSINCKESPSVYTDDSGSDDDLQPEIKNKDKNISDSEDSDDGESDDYSIIKFQKKSNSEEDDDDDDGGGGGDDDDDDDDEEEEEDDDDDDREGYDISNMEEPMKENFEHLKKQNVTEEAKKGASVRNQLLLWEGLLEMRIHLQRCMNTANQMPMPETFTELKQNSEIAEESTTTKTNVANLLNKLLTLQNILYKKYPETKTLCTKNQGKMTNGKKEEQKVESDEEIPSDTEDEEIPSDTDAEDNVEKSSKLPEKNVKNSVVSKKRKLEDYEDEISKSHKAFKTFRDTTIQKWNDKTRLATATNMKTAPTNTILQQISYILSDRNKLIRRSQLKRSEYDIIGYKKQSAEDDQVENGTEENPVTKNRKCDDEYIPEIFDDSDFYHQLLRELIECKSSDITDPVQLSRQWVTLQQLRSKMKRKVDTKATKGRKIKYVVHKQLVNFLAPEKNTTWTEESTNELYSSLFGKMFEDNNIGFNANLDNGLKIKN